MFWPVEDEMVQINRGESEMNDRSGHISLDVHLEAQARRLTDQCTLCGKCVEVCPSIKEGSPLLHSAKPVDVVTSIVDFLKGGDATEIAETWAETCMGSGACITQCPEAINPRLMISIALNRIRTDKTVRGVNPTATYYRRMSQIIKLAAGMQMSPEQYQRITGRKGNPAHADLVFYLGCNVIRTPVIVFSAMDILDEIGADYAMLGGASNCCGVIHLKLHGDVEGADALGGTTIDKMASYEPSKVLTWCPTCVLEFGETTDGFKSYPFDFQHYAHYLAQRLDAFRDKLRPMPQRVALHRHDGGLGIDKSVETLLRAIPELELVALDEHEHWAYGCGPGALANVEAMREQSHQDTMRSAVDAKADVLATLYHTCQRDLCVFEGQYPIQVKNWTGILATALGLPEHEDHYKQMKLHSEISAALEDTREFIEANKLDMSSLRKMLPPLLEGKEKGLSFW
jgi:Fe-S oxidoreductase